MSKLDILKKIEFGERVAEEEADNLEQYFVETDQWNQMCDGNIDVVYGAKGSGKSALYTLLNKKESLFFDRGILITSAENVRGATVFRAIVADPPPSEISFTYLWKLYCLVLVANTLRYYEVQNKSSKVLINSLEEARLLPTSGTLSTLFRAVSTYLKGWIGRDTRSVEYAISMDPISGIPTVSRKREFACQSDDQNLSDIPVDELLGLANEALLEEQLNLWVLFDRLDVAFAESQELERNALRALFRAYNDLKAFPCLSLKIFVRDDIWRKITTGGFTEASHITKSVHISWSPESLLSLIVRRILNNQELVEFVGADPVMIRSDYDQQKELLYKLIPDQVDSGKNPSTFDWIVSRTTDATGNSVPREIIHLMDLARELQIKALERGSSEPDGEYRLFERNAFKEALPKVSKVRYEQTLLAEHPEMRERLQVLEGEKSEQTPGSLSKLWNIETAEAIKIGKRLAEIGFFETRGSKDDPTFWVPFLYRGALNLVQGRSE